MSDPSPQVVRNLAFGARLVATTADFSDFELRPGRVAWGRAFLSHAEPEAAADA